MHVIGVGVCEQHGIDGPYARGHELQPQLGRRVDQEPAAPGLDERGRAGPPVARIPVPRNTSLTSHDLDFEQVRGA
ncbi:MAG: hypothetical protein DMD67_14740 [Gemmatimonadetes bacterium]|nr:MAG: hypothetical protein DMD67_14740 [Gemmatimonadota bacterium]